MKILLIEDDDIDALLIHRTLTDTLDQVFSIEHVDRIATAEKMLANDDFDVILLDLSLPDGQGIYLVERLQSLEKNLPIIILTGLEDEETAVKAMQQGVQDYLFKADINGSSLSRSIRYAIERQRLTANLEAAREELVKTERLRVLAETARAAAHEIKNPLAVISGYAELLMRDLADDSSHREHAQAIYQSCREIDGIVEKMAAVRRYTTKEHGSSQESIVDFRQADA
jgi:DNA-binding NtrC family response regulator